MKNKTILFVCTANVKRSVIAEYCLKDYLLKNHIEGIETYSAGMSAPSDTSNFSMTHFSELKKINIDASGHKPRQVDENLVKKANLIIVFDNASKQWLKDKFNLNALLFNEVYKNESSETKGSNFEGDKDARTISELHYIYNAIPTLYKNLVKYI